MGKATICLFTVAGLILVTAALPLARAVATMTPVTFTDFTPPQTATFERRWIDDQNVFHVRGLTVFGQVSGDISGTFKVVVDENIDLATLTGDVSGSFVLTTDVGAWSGHSNGTFTGPGCSGPCSLSQLVGQGSGGLEGTKIMFTSANTPNLPPGTGMDMGVILNPHG